MDKSTPKKKEIDQSKKQDDIKPTTNYGKYKPIPRVGGCAQC